MERILQAQQGEAPKQLRIMELNPDHEIVQKLQEKVRTAKDDPSIDDYAELLLGYALIAEGSELANATKFNQAVSKLIVESI